MDGHHFQRWRIITICFREEERELIPICKQMEFFANAYSPLQPDTWQDRSEVRFSHGTGSRVAMGKYDKTKQKI